MVLASWNYDELAALQLLKTVAQHRTVDLREDVLSDLNDQVGPDANDVAVECGVMELAHGESVAHDWESCGMGVRADVSGIEKLDMV